MSYQQSIEEEFAKVTGSSQVEKLIEQLTEANSKLPAFAFPAACDAIYTLGDLCRSHSNASDEFIEQCMGLMSAVLLNALTDHTITIVNEEGIIAD